MCRQSKLASKDENIMAQQGTQRWCCFHPSHFTYNDRGVRYKSGHPALSRQLYKGTEEGSLFKESLKKALELIDKSTNNLLMVNSFNEWHEDSQIGPLWPHLVSLSSRQQLGLST
jgi:hypothetical protein